MNRAAQLLQETQRRAIERLSWSLLSLFAAGGVAMVPAVLAGWPGVLLGLLFLGTCTLRVMVLSQEVVTLAIGETAAVYAVVGRVVEFRVAEWRVVGIE